MAAVRIVMALKMETVCFTETFVSTYKSKRRYSPKDQHRHLHRCGNLRSYNVYLIFELIIM
jgi:hypothetical protein